MKDEEEGDESAALRVDMGNSRVRIQNAEFRMQNSEFRMQNAECRICKAGVYGGVWTSLVLFSQAEKRFFEIVVGEGSTAEGAEKRRGGNDCFGLPVFRRARKLTADGAEDSTP
jgi:hypothetical protein